MDVGNLDLVEVGHRLLDILDTDLAVLDRQQILQRLARQPDVAFVRLRARARTELRKGQTTDWRTLRSTP